jgi:hypothetical protein
MTKYAVLNESGVVEAFEEFPDDFVLGVDVVHPDLAIRYVMLAHDDEPVVGARREDGGGWTPPPVAPPEPVPPVVVTPRQFRLALLGADLLDDVEDLMAAPATPRAMRIEWEYATEIRSDYSGWTQMLALIDKSHDDLMALFDAAAQIL